VRYCTVTDGQGNRPSQLAFLEQQRRHPCTDCGHAFLTADHAAEGLHFSRMVVGGGTVVSSKHGPITEVHILPHCGTELPHDLLDEFDEDQLPTVSRLVHENADLGTGAIYRNLVENVVTGQSRGIVVAGFHLSRILLDANRVKPEEQLPLRPYVGSADLYSHYLREHGDELRESALLPWLGIVDGMLREMVDGVVYHHHTYDVSSLSPRPWDRGPDLKRPAFQLIWQKPTWEQVYEHDEPSMVEGLVPRADIEGVRDRISGFLHNELGVDSDGAIDFPLRLPVVPFSGARVGDPPDTPHHVVYDLRKDILGTEELIRSWVVSGPWRLAAAREQVAGQVLRMQKSLTQ
jgi:hypothetical protein